MAEEDIVVDGLVATIGANKNAALEVLETIRYCKMNWVWQQFAVFPIYPLDCRNEFLLIQHF